MKARHSLGVTMRHLRSLFDLKPDEVREILRLSADLKTRFQAGDRPALLQGRVLAMVFEKPSLRTRNSFEAAMLHLGGGGIFITSKEAGLHGRESLPDIARVLSSYSDAIALRTFSQKLIEDFAAHARCPIINALSDDRHPCQALTDLFTIQEVFGTLKDLHLFYLGDGNNVAKSLAIATAYMGMRLTVASPQGFELPAEFRKLLQRRVPTARLTVTNQIDAVVSTADIIYTDVWASMGQESEADDRRSKFAPFQVNAQLMAKAPKDCRFMHDLPAHRGEEVTDEVLDGPNSIAFLQAENRMHLAKGLLVWLIKPGL
jgi:ornithine carbamoyltransferase